MRLFDSMCCSVGAILFLVLAFPAPLHAEHPSITRLRQKAEAGDVESMREYAFHCSSGLGVKKNPSETIKWAQKAAEAGNTMAMEFLGRLYEEGRGIPQDETKAKEWYGKAYTLYLNAAGSGDAFAMSRLGDCYNYGIYVSKNVDEANKWYLKSFNIHMKNAEAGNRKAMLALATLIDFGPIPYSTEERYKWCRKAFTVGDIGREDEVMLKFFAFAWASSFICNELSGFSTEEISGEVFKWYQKGAEIGSATAMSDLGEAYYRGEGVRKNDYMAAKWYIKAADAGDRRAMERIGECYEKGEGVPQDFSLAVKNYRDAADFGNQKAMHRLGLCYANGKGVTRNYVYAYAWLNFATTDFMGFGSGSYVDVATIRSNDGEKLKPAQSREIVLGHMTPEMVAQAQALTKEWVENGTAGEVLEDGETLTDKQPNQVGRLPVASGTGFFVTTDGYLITAAHVVKNAAKLEIPLGGKTLSVRVIRVDEKNDVALLKAEGNFQAISLAASRSVTLGTDVFTIGFPNIDIQGESPKLTKGAVSALNGIQDDPSCFQISVAVQPGNSGGPLVNSAGTVVGVVVARLNDRTTVRVTGAMPQNVNYAVKSAYVQPLLDAIPDGSPLPKPLVITTSDRVVSLVEKAVCIVLVYK